MHDELKLLLDWEMDTPELHVEWDPNLLHLSAAASDYIDKRWNVYQAAAKSEGRMLFNGPITRLISARLEKTPAVARAILRLGPADYKSFVVTRLRDRPWFDAHDPDAAVLALGNSALLTHGNHALLGIRSQKVSAYPGRAHLFGGVAELLNTEKFPATTQGLIAHLRLELHEEAEILSGELAPQGPQPLGLALDEYLGQPELSWRWETTVPLETIARRLDAEEHSGHILIDRRRLSDVDQTHLTPVARRTIQVWALQK